MSTFNVHHTPPELYDALAEEFGESIIEREASTTRWVSVGAGSVSLTFFRTSIPGQAVKVDRPDAPQVRKVEPVLR